MPGRIVVSVLYLLHWLWSIGVYVALVAAAAGLLDRAPAALELLSSVWRIEVAAILKATFSRDSCWAGRNGVGCLVEQGGAERRLRRGSRRLGLWRRRGTWNVRLVLDCLE